MQEEATFSKFGKNLLFSCLYGTNADENNKEIKKNKIIFLYLNIYFSITKIKTIIPTIGPVENVKIFILCRADPNIRIEIIAIIKRYLSCREIFSFFLTLINIENTKNKHEINIKKNIRK